MNETTYFGERLRKRSLPVFDGSPPSDAAGPMRLFLPQGELAHFCDVVEGIQYAAYVELHPGKIRGNHVHRVKEEQVYLISGEVLLVAQDGEAGERLTLTLVAGDMVLIRPGVAHAFKPMSVGSAVEFSRTRLDRTDVQRVMLL